MPELRKAVLQCHGGVSGRLLLSLFSSSLWPHGLQHSRLPCPSWSPRVCSNSCPLRHDAIQPSQPLLPSSPPALNPSQHQGLLQWVGSSHQVPNYWSFSFSIGPSNEHSVLISFRMDSLQSRELSRVSSSTTVWRHQFFGAQPSLWFKSHICTWLLEKTIALTIWTFVGKVMSLLFNTLVNNECSYCRAGFPQILTCIKSC